MQIDFLGQARCQELLLSRQQKATLPPNSKPSVSSVSLSLTRQRKGCICILPQTSCLRPEARPLPGTLALPISHVPALFSLQLTDHGFVPPAACHCVSGPCAEREDAHLRSRRAPLPAANRGGISAGRCRVAATATTLTPPLRRAATPASRGAHFRTPRGESKAAQRYALREPVWPCLRSCGPPHIHTCLLFLPPCCPTCPTRCLVPLVQTQLLQACQEHPATGSRHAR